MRRRNVFKTIIILFVVVWSLFALYPTFQLAQQRDRAEEYYQVIEQNTNLNRDEIAAALASGNLELQVRENFKGTDGQSLEDVISVVDKLSALYSRISENQGKAIRLGLDLQGGSYLVYEVDMPQLLRSVAKIKDERLEAALDAAVRRSRENNEDFLEVLQQVFAERNLSLRRYFGSPRDSEEEIISQLGEEAEDAIDRTLEILRNRIDQFGVSEPTITKQGAQRIVIELAGVQDVERAKGIIGTTALLEFKLEKNPEEISAVLDRINQVMKQQMKDQPEPQEGVEGEALTEATEDTAEATSRPSADAEVSLQDVLGGSGLEDSDLDRTSGDSVLVDEQTLERQPFNALLRNIGGDIGVPTKNVRAVEAILSSPEVESVIPGDAEFLWSAEPEFIGDQEYYRLFMVKKEPELTGAMITDAQVQIGSQLEAGRPIVAMELNSEGARIFSKVTGANVGRRLAIILDNKIVSIPNIRERIPHGSASITGMANMEEARDLAIVLRAGALPAPIEVIEERTVGPSLGRDSIRKGTVSALVGFGVVIVFMVFYYRLSGLVADLALLLNLIIIMAILAGFHATLTLPGVAGIILTIGMAVDANVLIFERIREELRTGKTIRAAIDNGYARAFKAILDANVTTLLTALVLYQFGTGPIRGFALTLSIGILASMFTAIVVTRVIFDYVLDKFAVQKLSI